MAKSPKRAKIAHLETQPADVWTWTPKQRAFINSDARHPLIMGGVGSGKTAALCRRALRFAAAYPGNYGLLCRYTLGESNDTLLVTWRKVVPASLYSMRSDRWGWVITVATRDPATPSTILVRALDNEQKYQSLELGFFGISQANEQLITRGLWDTLTSRLRWMLPDGSRPPYTGFAEANSGAPWVNDLWRPDRTHDMPGYEAVEVSMFDNEANLPADYIVAMSAKPAWWAKYFIYPCWEELAELEGDPVFAGHFRTELHVAAEPLVPEEGWPIVRGWDLPGQVATCWFQVTRRGKLLVLYEQIGTPSDSIAEMKRRALEASRLLFPGWNYLDVADPAAWTKSPTDLRSPADLLRPEIVLTKGETTLTARLSAAQQWMDRIIDGKPALQIDPRCRVTIAACQGGYCWKMVQGRVIPEPQKNLWSHPIDAWLHALARVSGQLDPVKRRAWMGPKVLIPVP